MANSKTAIASPFSWTEKYKWYLVQKLTSH